MLATSPVSSYTSRSAAAASVSPGSIRPLGNVQRRRPCRSRWRTTAMRPRRSITRPPADVHFAGRPRHPAAPARPRRRAYTTTIGKTATTTTATTAIGSGIGRRVAVGRVAGRYLHSSVTSCGGPLDRQPDEPAEHASWIRVCPQSPDSPGCGAHPALGHVEAPKLSHDASGYLRSTLLLQFQSHEPLGPATAWKLSSGFPGMVEQAAVFGS